MAPNQNLFQPTPRAFISYARADGESFATKLRERLECEQPEITLWQDRTQLEGGVGWWKQITEALDQVEFLIMVMTPAAMTSEVARKEWRYARQQGVRICPVMGVPPRQLEFAALPRWMSKSHFYDLDREWETFVGFLKSAPRDNRVPFMAPDLREDFVERSVELTALLSNLLDLAHTNPVAITTALQGFGGFGKTTLAIALCHNEDVITAFDDGILWATLGQNPNIQHELTKLYAALTGERPPFIDIEDAAIQLAERLEDKTCLIVLDDVWDPNHLKPFLRGGASSARLITTRRLEVVTDVGARRVLVDEMTQEESVRMLTTRLRAQVADPAPFQALARRLGEWPLLLKLAASQLRERTERGDSVEGAMAYVNRALDKRGAVAFDRENPVARTDAVRTTVGASLELLRRADRVRCAELAIFPEDKVIPLSAAGALWGMDDFDTEELVQKLDGAALLDFDLKTGSIRIHDVLRAYLHSQLEDPRAVHVRLLQSAWSDPYRLPDTFAWRWLGWHLAQAGQHQRLRALLLDFAWLKAKLEATDVRALLLDFELLPGSEDLDLLHDALRLAAHGLNRDPAQLAAQLKGRLERGRLAALDRLLDQAEAAVKRPWLTLGHPSLTRPGGPLVAILKGHTASVEAVAFCPAPPRAVSGSGDWTLRVWDLDTGRTIRTLDGHQGLVHCLAVTPDGKKLVSGSEDRTVRVWELETGQLEHVLKGHSGPVHGVTIGQDGRVAASVSEDGTVRRWDLGTLRSTLVFKGPSHQLRAIAITPDGRRLLFAQGDWTLALLDLESGVVLATLEGHSGVVRAVAVTADGLQALSASEDRTLRLWDLEAAKTLRVLSGHSGSVEAVAIAADGARALSSSSDQTIRMWDLQTGETLHALEGHSGFVRAVAVTADGRQAISGSGDKTVRYWNVHAAPKLQSLKAHSEPVSLLAISSDGRTVISGSRGSALRVWDAGRDQVVGILEGHQGLITNLWLDAAGKQAVTSARDGALRVWDLSPAALVRNLANPQGVRSARICADGTRAVCVSRDRTIRMWDLQSGRATRVLVSAEGGRAGPSLRTGSALLLELELAPVVDVCPKAITHDSGVAISPDGTRVLLALASSLCVWDVETGGVLSEELEDTDMSAVAFDAQGSVAVLGSLLGTLRVWDLTHGKTLHLLQGHAEGIVDVVIPSDGRTAITADRSDALRMWDLQTGVQRTTMTGKAGRVDAVSIAPNGEFAYSVYGDTVVASHVKRGAVLGSISVDHQITSVAVAPDGRRLALGDESGRVHFLRLEETLSTGGGLRGS